MGGMALPGERAGVMGNAAALFQSNAGKNNRRSEQPLFPLNGQVRKETANRANRANGAFGVLGRA
jgi:hypothetical protein